MHTSDFTDITFLTEKYGATGDFDGNDDTIVKNRLNINLVLRELKDMGWINLAPQNGLATGHMRNQVTNKREFILDAPVKARLTTKGEMEYKQSKQSAETTKGHSVNIGGDSHAPIMVNSDGSFQVLNQHPKEETKKDSGIKKFGKWILENIWKIAIGVLIAYICVKLGIKK